MAGFRRFKKFWNNPPAEEFHSGKCRDCGEVRKIRRNEQRAKSPPRCFGCGGMLDMMYEKVKDPPSPSQDSC